MGNGPVVSRIYDLIRGEPAPGTDPIWRRYVAAPEGWEVALLAEPEPSEHSPVEEALIAEIYAKFGKMSMHRDCPGRTDGYRAVWASSSGARHGAASGGFENSSAWLSTGLHFRLMVSRM